MSLEEIVTKYDKIKLQNKIRQKRYYDKHQEQILLKKKDQRELFNQLKRQQQPLRTQQPNQPIETPVFSSLTTKELKGVKKTNKSTTSLKDILERLKNFSMTGSQDTYRTYRTNVEQLYALTNTNKEKAINLNDVKFIFDKLDNFKKYNGEPYGIDKLFLMIQVILILSDPSNHFELDVSKPVFEIYKSKFNEFKILKSRKQESNQIKEVPLFTTILNKAKEHYGEKSEFYLYLLIYSLSPMRDDHQLNIVNDIKKANKKTENYIVVKKTTGNIIINHYKTQAKYQQLTYEITPNVLKLVKGFIETKEFDYNKDDYLFGAGKMSKWVGSSLKQLGVDIKGQCINVLRHSIVSEFHILNPDATAKQQLDFATSLGHSHQMDLQYIRQIGAL